LVNESPFKTAAIDIPSGLSDSFLPEQGVAIDAEVTATFQALKWIHIAPDGNTSCGKIQVIDIGIPPQLLQEEKYYIELITPPAFKDLLKQREVDAHKGSFGHCLNISGSIEKPGAGILSNYASLKAGAGLCTAATGLENRLAAVQAHPEIMTLVYEQNSDLLGRLDEFDAVLVGPGLGHSTQTYDLVSLLMDHVSIREQRLEVAREFARESAVWLVLKGHHTLVVTPGGNVFVNQTGNPGMATAGSGDVLAGIIVGFIAQFYPRHQLEVILQAAVFLHGLAGDLAAEESGEISLTASDILSRLPDALGAIDEFRTPFRFS
jgi:NAD(P)H-hydrate epimerase